MLDIPGNLDTMSKSSEYYEKLAKEILEKYPHSIYTDLIQDDRPDLQDFVNNIGIEVTNSGDYKGFEADSTFKKIYGKHFEELTPLENDKVGELRSKDYSFEESGLNGIDLLGFPAKWMSNECILTEIGKKLKKLNRVGEQSYRDFDSYHLFIFSEYFLDYTEIGYFDPEKNEIVRIECKNQIFELIHEIATMQKSFTRKFTLIYILWISELYILDIENCKYCHTHTQAD